MVLRDGTRFYSSKKEKAIYPASRAIQRTQHRKQPTVVVQELKLLPLWDLLLVQDDPLAQNDANHQENPQGLPRGERDFDRYAQMSLSLFDVSNDI